jgi:DNA-binding transcriptional regulator YbjK
MGVRHNGCMETDRKTLIADAVLHLLGRVGSKGVTHRAVDAQAGLPNGSTSFYCRTRLELLKQAVVRHAALDLADLAQDALRWHTAQPDRACFVDQLAARVMAWSAPDKRWHLRARFELMLLATREPELAEVLDAQRQQFVGNTRKALKALSLSEPESKTRQLIQCVDGMLVSQLADQATPLSLKQVRDLLTRVLA